jgi:two-component sensor histidine kinase
MPEARAAEVMITVHDLAANAVRHGAGAGQAARFRGGVA